MEGMRRGRSWEQQIEGQAEERVRRIHEKIYFISSFEAELFSVDKFCLEKVVFRGRFIRILKYLNFPSHISKKESYRSDLIGVNLNLTILFWISYIYDLVLFGDAQMYFLLK